MTDRPLFAAMAKAFHEIEGATKSSLNPHFKSKYADLSSVVAAVKPALEKHGLWFRQISHPSTGGVEIETLICHEGGEEISCGNLFVPASKNDAQAYGSALSYARRYSLMAAFGVCPEDDDGNAAAANPPRQEELAQQGRQTPPPLKGPIKTRADLRNACAAFTRDLHGCGDQDMLDQVLRDNKALTDQVQDEHEFFWNGDGTDFLGLAKEIEAAKTRVNERN